MMKKRAEAARRKRLDHLFTKADDNCNGKITPQQMIKLFAANGEVCASLSNKPCKSHPFKISASAVILYIFGCYVHIFKVTLISIAHYYSG